MTITYRLSVACTAALTIVLAACGGGAALPVTIDVIPGQSDTSEMADLALPDLLEELTPVDFIGDQYLVPSPPDDYLTFKYGPDWRTPKQVGYEKDVIDAMPRGTVPGRAGWLKQWFIVRFAPQQTGRLLVLDGDGEPVAGAEVRIAGLSRSRTNRGGVARFYLPVVENYAVTVVSSGLEEVLYEEALEPGKRYVYRPDPAQSAGRYFVLTEG